MLQSLAVLHLFLNLTANNFLIKMFTIASWKHTQLVTTPILIDLHSTINILMMLENHVVLTKIFINISPPLNSNRPLRISIFTTKLLTKAIRSQEAMMSFSAL